MSGFLSALFHYFVQFPNILKNPDELLFEGPASSISNNFENDLNKVLATHADEIETNFNIKLEDVHIYSYQECAHTRLNCGATDGPSGAAACIRGSHLLVLGMVRNIYIQQEKSSH